MIGVFFGGVSYVIPARKHDILVCIVILYRVLPERLGLDGSSTGVLFFFCQW